MKVIERAFERMIRETAKIDTMQFEFMPGKGTTDAIFTIQHVQLTLLTYKCYTSYYLQENQRRSYKYNVMIIKQQRIYKQWWW